MSQHQLFSQKCYIHNNQYDQIFELLGNIFLAKVAQIFW